MRGLHPPESSKFLADFRLTNEIDTSTRVDTTSRCPPKISAAEAYFPTSRIALRAAKGGKLGYLWGSRTGRVTRIMSVGLLLEVDRLRSWSCTTSSLNVNKRERVSGHRHHCEFDGKPLRRELPDERQRLLVVTVRSELKNQPSAGRQIPGIKISRVCAPGKMPASFL